MVIAATASRRVLYMNETARACRCGIELAGGLEHVDVDELNRRLSRLLHNRDGYHTALDLLAQRARAG